MGPDILQYRRQKEKDQLDAKLETIKTASLKYHKRLEFYSKMMESGYAATNEKKTSKDVKGWLSVRKKKLDGAMPLGAEKLRELEEKLKDRPVLGLRDYLVDEGKDEELIDQYLDHYFAQAAVEGVVADVDVPVQVQQEVPVTEAFVDVQVQQEVPVTEAFTVTI